MQRIVLAYVLLYRLYTVLDLVGWLFELQTFNTRGTRFSHSAIETVQAFGLPIGPIFGLIDL